MQRLLIFVLSLTVVGCSWTGSSECSPSLEEGHSIARAWNEATLHAIGRDFPAPTVHSRNLFHSSAAMWDAWAAYDDGAAGSFIDADAPDQDRETAISFAAYGVLRSRYALAGGGKESLDEFELVMTNLCLDPQDPNRSDPTTAAGFGTMIAEQILSTADSDGSRERDA